MESDMYAFKKILVPTDFSDVSNRAFPFAEIIAGKYGATVDFLHIIPTMRYFRKSMVGFEIPYDIEKDIYPRIQKQSIRKLNRLMDDSLQEEHRGEANIQISPKPSAAIADYARENNYELIVMGSRGADETSMLRGSVTEKVIRYSEVPVFATTEGSTADRIKRIIFPTDGSQLSFAAFPYAVSLAKVYQARITLFHAIELYGTALDYPAHDPHKTEGENVYEDIIRQLETYLDQRGEEISVRRGEEPLEDELILQEGASSITIAMKTEISRGATAHQAIEEFAREHSDMVAMATHGHTGLAHFFLGSTTEQIAQRLDKPVLTVKPAKEDLK